MGGPKQVKEEDRSQESVVRRQETRGQSPPEAGKPQRSARTAGRMEKEEDRIQESGDSRRATPEEWHR
jgi:hypothetical protein